MIFEARAGFGHVAAHVPCKFLDSHRVKLGSLLDMRLKDDKVNKEEKKNLIKKKEIDLRGK